MLFLAKMRLLPLAKAHLLGKYRTRHFSAPASANVRQHATYSQMMQVQVHESTSHMPPFYVVYRILVRAISYTVHGLIPASCVFADRYNREEVVRSLGKEVNLNPPLTLGQLPDTPEELLKLDQVSKKIAARIVFVKSC